MTSAMAFSFCLLAQPCAVPWLSGPPDPVCKIQVNGLLDSARGLRTSLSRHHPCMYGDFLLLFHMHPLRVETLWCPAGDPFWASVAAIPLGAKGFRTLPVTLQDTVTH